MIDKPATYWHMLPAFSQGRKAIWTAVNPHTGKRRIDEAFPHELRVNTNELEMFIRFKNGSTWQVVGSDRYDAAVGSSPAGITFSEWALSNPSAWAYLAPIVTDLLNNKNIRDVIDTVGKKGVLLLGRFTKGRIKVLERLSESGQAGTTSRSCSTSTSPQC